MELQRAQEYGKRPYQKILAFLLSALITLAVCVLLGWILNAF